ncbi:putative FBD-associated F-box protein At1g61330 isoform X1 [Brachypodium distachyon]|uniref:At1g61320/AtMIF1 LRR domain-containing protein n=1 Tax=Brachypodium distachyon TaxID=15368 RepID=A0A0Q3MJA4_BRADI|nr:putative FBD-associated F-box protein At1g61330 isoform X1 [Brachypodium distachyon]KQK04446.1 hypothetical protein BRADI_2g13550v3 [Brachypodium distachyon]|eukprot:XP_003565784.1 putative FBD-associated F-box protein At1g61330 isoform X1 [Brachypodium distachyon]
MALDSDGDGSAKRPRADEEGNQGGALDGDAIAKRLRVDEEGNQGDTVALESYGDDDTTEKGIHGDATVGVLALVPDGDAGARIPREDEEGNQADSTAGATTRATRDPLSDLPDDLRLKILTLLPLKSAIHSSVLSKVRPRVWESHSQDRECPHPFFLHYDLVAGTFPSPEQLLELLQLRRGNHLHRFSLVVDRSGVSALCFKRILERVADCAVEDLHIELRSTSAKMKIAFHFPKSSRTLVRLSLRDINVSHVHYKNAQVFSNLEVIHLYAVRINDDVLCKMAALCPVLRILDLCYCDRLSDVSRLFERTNLMRTLTVAECAGVRVLDVRPVFGLRSFRYSGSFLWPFYLPRSVAFTDLYICYNVVMPPHVSGQWFDNTLSNTSELTVLTICSNALQAVSSLTDAGVQTGIAKVGNFQKLKELQLIMFEMKAVNLADIYAFLKNCHCPILKSLFVQLPTVRSDMPLVDAHNDVIEEPPEDVLENLKVVKVMNFSCHHIAVQLVLFLLRKAKSLHKLLLVAPDTNQLNVSDIPDIQQADRLLLNGSLANGKLVLERCSTAPRPLHSEVFAKL